MKSIALVASRARAVGATMFVGMTLGWFGMSPARAAVHALKFAVNTPGPDPSVFYLDDPNLNGRPSARLIVTQVLGFSATANPHPVGVWFDVTQGAKGMWCIFNEDHAAIPAPAAFNVLVCAAAVVHASDLNSTANITFFSAGKGKPPFSPAPPAGKKPGYLFFTHNFEPFPAIKGGLYVGHYQSLSYSSAAAPRPEASKWYISNEDGSPAVAAGYFVFDASTPPKGTIVFGHTTTAANTSHNQTNLSIAADSSAVIFVTPVGDQNLNLPVSIFPFTPWAIGTSNGADLPLGVRFNVLVFPHAENVP